MTLAVPLHSHPARLAARAAGMKTFDPGYVCAAHSHQSRRFVISGHCLACTEIKNAKRKTGKSRGRPSSRAAPQMAAKGKLLPVKARFNSPALTRALLDYVHTVEAKQHSAHLNRLTRQMLKGSPHG
jgi:hypothetical protein